MLNFITSHDYFHATVFTVLSIEYDPVFILKCLFYFYFFKPPQIHKDSSALLSLLLCWYLTKILFYFIIFFHFILIVFKTNVFLMLQSCCVGQMKPIATLLDTFLFCFPSGRFIHHSRSIFCESNSKWTRSNKFKTK